MSAPSVPAQCTLCAQFNKEEMICPLYDTLPGEYGREDVKECPSFFDGENKSELSLLAQYIDEDPDRLVEQRLQAVVNNILDGYEEKFKIMVVGIARRKIKSLIKMVDITDSLLDNLSEREALVNLSASQSIRLLSQLNSSINNDLAFIMRLVDPDTKLRDLQMWVDARSVINVNGASMETELKSEEILNLTGVSRDKIRDAFDSLLHNISPGVLEDEHVVTEEDMEELKAYEDNR